MLPEHLQLIHKAAEVHGLNNYSIEHEHESEKGRNYLSIITPLTIIENDGDSVLHLILKTAQINEPVRSRRPIVPAFEREVEFYENILPELLKFQGLYHLRNPFTGSAKYFGSTNQHCKEAILMQNLHSDGYTLFTPAEAMDFNHMAVVFEEYAKFHALSLALRDKNLEKFEMLTKNVEKNFLELREASNQEHYKYLISVVLDMGRKAVHGSEKALKAHQKFKDSFLDFWDYNKENPEMEILAVIHGDCHPNNILFKYDAELPISSPKEVCLIDWQLSSVQSPVRDISFVLFACASKDALERSEELFRIYHKVVSQNLTEFGCDCDKVLSYSTFIKHWKKHYFHGLYRAQMTLKLTLMPDEELHKLGGSNSIIDVLKNDFSPQSNFAQRMKYVFEIVGGKWL